MTKKKTTTDKPTDNRRRTNAKTKTTRGGTGSRAKSSGAAASRNSASRSSTSRGSASRKSDSTPAPRKRSSTRQAKPRTRTAQEIRLSVQQKALVVGIVTVFLTAVLTLSLISPNQGQLTGALFDMLWRVFGWGGLIIPFITGGTGLFLVLWGMDQHPTLPT
ncbi:MAG: hypothetical protein KC443_17885, partial [Anaerolineales bacterium]|nr:hypothetical protein [Anaerolineales bacterium]